MTKNNSVEEKPLKKEHSDKAEDSCRCKDVSKKSFTELLKLMVSDLVFWRKTKRN
jgi:hypothetical protein